MKNQTQEDFLRDFAFRVYLVRALLRDGIFLNFHLTNLEILPTAPATLTRRNNHKSSLQQQLAKQQQSKQHYTMTTSSSDSPQRSVAQNEDVEMVAGSGSSILQDSRNEQPLSSVRWSSLTNDKDDHHATANNDLSWRNIHMTVVRIL